MAHLDLMMDSFADELEKIAEEKKQEESAWQKLTRFTTSPAGRISGAAMQGGMLGGKTIPMIRDLIKGKGWGAAEAQSGKGALIGAALGAGVGYLLRNTDPLFGVRPKEKQAGMFSTAGKAVSNTVGNVGKRITNAGRALKGKGPLLNDPAQVGPLVKSPPDFLTKAKEVGKKGLMGAGLVGIGAAGGAALMHNGQNQGQQGY